MASLRREQLKKSDVCHDMDPRSPWLTQISSDKICKKRRCNFYVIKVNRDKDKG